MFVVIRLFCNMTNYGNFISVLISIMLGGLIYVTGIIIYANININSIYHLKK